MYSILMAGNDSDWAVAQGVPQRDWFSLSRYLEYTDQELERALKPVSAETLAGLEGSDAIFMSELQADPLEGGDYVTMRLGRVSDLSVGRGRIEYTFVMTAIWAAFRSTTARYSKVRSISVDGS